MFYTKTRIQPKVLKKFSLNFQRKFADDGGSMNYEVKQNFSFIGELSLIGISSLKS